MKTTSHAPLEFRIFRALCALEAGLIEKAKPLLSDDGESRGWFRGEIMAHVAGRKPGYLTEVEAFENLEKAGAILQADFSRCGVHEPLWRTA